MFFVLFSHLKLQARLFLDLAPQCADVVDVWGRDGKTMVVWQPPKQLPPLYYIFKYGLADQVVSRNQCQCAQRQAACRARDRLFRAK